MRILLVEDEEKLATLLRRGLGEDGHDVEVAADGDAAAAAVDAGFDVVVLDWSLPQRDGLSLLRLWRSRGLAVPVLMLTARDSTEERVQALRAGADDHLGKPFAYEELLARLEALHRRAVAERLVGDVVVDEKQRSLRRGEAAVVLTAREWALLSALLAKGGDSVARGALLDRVWGDDYDGAGNVVDVYVGYVRQKLQQIGARRVRISAVRGVGYRLDVDDGDDGDDGSAR